MPAALKGKPRAVYARPREVRLRAVRKVVSIGRGRSSIRCNKYLSCSGAARPASTGCSGNQPGRFHHRVRPILVGVFVFAHRAGNRCSQPALFIGNLPIDCLGLPFSAGEKCEDRRGAFALDFLHLQLNPQADDSSVPSSLFPAILPSMPVLSDFKSLTHPQRRAFLAAFLGWTLDSPRLLPADLLREGDCGGIPHQTLGSAGRGLPHAGFSACGRAPVWQAGRPLRTQAGADGQHPQLLRSSNWPAPLRLRSTCCWCCGHCLALPWAVNGA